MKKQLAILAVLTVVLVCLSVAIVYSNDRKANQTVKDNTQAQVLQTKLDQANTRLHQHDQVSEFNLKSSAGTIITLQSQKTALCAQIKAARLVQPICQ